MFVEVKEIELLPEPAMIAELRLLDPLEVGVEVGLRVEGRAVDPGELGVLLVAAPVRTGSFSASKRLRASSAETSSRVHWRPSASSRRISSSIRGRSSSRIGSGNSKS